MAKQRKNAISPTRSENYPEWYQQVVKAGELAENSQVRGCMVIKPWGYGMWENMQRFLDDKFKETGHVNAYFPLFIPLSFLQKEADHVEGFAKECAVVTHHRLEAGEDGKLEPAGKLEEPLVIRPTSETIIGDTYSRWVKSYRDLPILINQWANVVRWEMRPRLFLRTAEFLWQEGHTVHATKEEAMAETRQMLDVYTWFARDILAIPVIPGEKTADERFPGADRTYTIEGMMQDGKALQAGTSHFLGQNFAKAQSIKYLSSEGKEEFAWTTSWGVSTRLVGGVVMAHGDDDGLILPPAIATQQIVILPVLRKDGDNEMVMKSCHELKDDLVKKSAFGKSLRVHIDKRALGGGEKAWEWIKKGVPYRAEVGPKEIENDQVFLADRLSGEKCGVSRDEFMTGCGNWLEDFQNRLLKRAEKFQQKHLVEIANQKDFESYFEKDDTGFALCPVAEGVDYGEICKALKVSARCIPLDKEKPTQKCVFSGKPADHYIYFAKAY